MTVNAISVGGLDLADPDSYANGVPFDAFGALRRQAPVAWHPYKDGPGFFALTCYDDVFAVSRDSETWSSQVNGIVFEPPTPEQQAAVEHMMLTMDPPRHTEFRKLINKGFGPREVSRLTAHVAALARQIVNEVIERGECDFANDVAGVLPSYVIAEMLGIPKEDGCRLYELVEVINNGNFDGDDRFVQALTQMYQYATELAARKRAVPGDDIATSLLHAEVDGKRLNDIEFNMFVVLLLNAGGETTRNLVAGGILALLEHRDQWQRLIVDPSLMPSAIEEMLRYVSPVMNFVRTATRDTTVRGITIRAGERAAMFYVSANRDESRFDNPDRFDINRATNQHLAFGGGGTHFCLGANLARVEAAAIISEVLDRMSGLELTAPVERTRSNQMNGIKSMPVRFAPGQRTRARGLSES